MISEPIKFKKYYKKWTKMFRIWTKSLQYLEDDIEPNGEEASQ